MKHIVFLQEVKKDKKEEYLKYHKECPKDLMETIKNAGIKREIIWINKEQLIVYIMSDDFEKAMANLAKQSIFKNWTSLMEPLLSEMQDYSEDGKINNLQKVFDLEEQLKTDGE
jgi:L-rhamnose mutarotase